MDRLQAAARVARLVVQDGVAQPVGEARRILLDPGVSPLQALALRHADLRPGSDQRVDQHRDVLRIVLAVAVDGRDDLVRARPALPISATGSARPSGHGGCGGWQSLPSAASRASTRRVSSVEPSSTTITSKWRPAMACADLGQQPRQVRRLVLAGNDNGYQCVRHFAAQLIARRWRMDFRLGPGQTGVEAPARPLGCGGLLRQPRSGRKSSACHGLARTPPLTGLRGSRSWSGRSAAGRERAHGEVGPGFRFGRVAVETDLLGDDDLAPRLACQRRAGRRRCCGSCDRRRRRSSSFGRRGRCSAARKIASGRHGRQRARAVGQFEPFRQLEREVVAVERFRPGRARRTDCRGSDRARPGPRCPRCRSAPPASKGTPPSRDHPLVDQGVARARCRRRPDRRLRAHRSRWRCRRC